MIDRTLLLGFDCGLNFVARSLVAAMCHVAGIAFAEV
jgi:hypothetical protein